MFRMSLFLLSFLLGTALQAAELISTNAAGTDSANDRSQIANDETVPVSADGRYVVFSSSADNFGPTDTNMANDLYLHDRDTDSTSLITAGTGGQGADAGTFTASISDDGRFVVFLSAASDITAATDTNGDTDVFIYDRVSGSTTLISKTAGGAAGNAFSWSFSMTPDAAFILFASDASDLDFGGTDANGTTDVYLYTRATDTITLISRVGVSNTAGDGTSRLHLLDAISHDGRYIVYTTQATDIVADAGGFEDAILYDTTLGTSTRITESTGSGPANGDTGFAIISGDGSVVIVLSGATDLVAAADTTLELDFFAYTRVSGLMRLVTVNAAGTAAATGGTNRRASRISDDDSVFVWDSGMTDLVVTDTNGVDDIFARDLVNGVTVLVSRNLAGTDSCNDDSDDPQLSASGRLVFYESDCTNNTADADANGDKNDSFMFDRETNTTYLLSESAAGNSTGDDFCEEPGISRNGLFTTIDCLAKDLDPNVADTNMQNDVYFVSIEDLIPGFNAIPDGSDEDDSSGGGGGAPAPWLVLGLALTGLLTRRFRD